MADDTEAGVTRQDLPDEMPRSAISDSRDRLRPDDGRGAPMLVWLLLAALVALVFILLLWAVGPLGDAGAPAPPTLPRP